MIENFGCDFFSSGLGHDMLESKVKNFFERKTSDGPRYDTYLLYYTGDVYDTGDWALAGNLTQYDTEISEHFHYMEVILIHLNLFITRFVTTRFWIQH